MIDLVYTGGRFDDHRLPYAVAVAIVELQKDVHKAFKLVKLGTETSGHLSDADKEMLEIAP